MHAVCQMWDERPRLHAWRCPVNVGAGAFARDLVHTATLERRISLSPPSIHWVDRRLFQGSGWSRQGSPAPCSSPKLCALSWGAGSLPPLDPAPPFRRRETAPPGHSRGRASRQSVASARGTGDTTVQGRDNASPKPAHGVLRRMARQVVLGTRTHAGIRSVRRMLLCWARQPCVHPTTRSARPPT
jgi:hypothetical protein